MKLPKKGQEITINELYKLAVYYEKLDIVKAIVNGDFPKSPTSSDGCSGFPDKWKKFNIYPACFWHDKRYCMGRKGDDRARLDADIELMKDVASITGDTNLARAMFFGVSGGGSEKLPLPWKWGYGW